MKRIYHLLTALSIFISLIPENIFSQSNTVQIVGGGTYNSITTAWSALPNPITAPTTIKLLAGYTGVNENWPINLTGKSGTSEVNTITICPAVSGLSISSSNIAQTIRLFGCSYVIIDGSINGTGASKDLAISNTSISGSTILFTNDAKNCTVKYCSISGVTTTASNTPSNGVINFAQGVTSSGNSNNTIDNCDIKNGATMPQALIYGKGTSYYNTNNTISNCNLYNFFSTVYNSYGIFIDTYDSAWTITDNSIYQSAGMTSTSGSTQHGIYLKSGSTGSYYVSGNYIGGTAPGCGGTTWSVGGSYANLFVGIYVNITGYGYNNIQGNTIGNFNWISTSTASGIPGVWSGIYIVNGNMNIGTTTGNTIGSPDGTGSIVITTSGSGATSYGICCGASPYNYNISKNSISSVTVSGTTSSITHNFTGIYSQSTASINIAKNFIHNIGLSVSSSSSALTGIFPDGGLTAVCNNMVSLGYDPAGNSITTGYKIYGIFEGNASTGTNAYSYYFNSIYVGGTGVASSQVTSSFYSGFATNSILKNNIFVNSRSNISGSASHFNVYLSSALPGTTPNIISDYNLFYFNGTGGKLGYYGGNIISLDNWKYSMQKDYNSGFGNPIFSAPAAANNLTDLHVRGTTPVEGSGLNIENVTEDFDGQARNGLTPVDIGADAGNFSAIDCFPPTILYSLIPNTSSTSNMVLTNFATIYDNIGVSSGANLPRIYYKRSVDLDIFSGNTSADNGWKYTIATNSSSPYSFNIDYNILFGTPVSGTIIQYFIVAQDDANNLSSNPFGAAASSNPPVQNINTKSTTPNSYIIASALCGIINVGTGNTYTSLTNAGGLFNAINNGVISGNLTVNITSNITESGTNFLNQVSEEGAGGYTITIQPDGSLRTISGTSTTSMIKFNGADRVIIDGGSSKLLTFRNTNSTASQTGSTIEFTNDAKNCVLKNCNIENNSTSSSRGCILLGNTGTDTNLVIIDNCNLRDATGGTTGSPYNCIYTNFTRNKITVSNCSIFNFISNGINLSGASDSCTIWGNSFYNNVPTPPSADQYSINIKSGSGHFIYGNFVGGQTANCGGSPWANSGTGTFYGINITVTTASSDVENNTISNISLTNTGAVNHSLKGISIAAGDVRKNRVYKLTSSSSGIPVITGIEKISSTTNNELSNNQVAIDGGTAINPVIYGINCASGSVYLCNIYYNSVVISGTASTTSTSYAFYKANNTAVLDIKDNIFINDRTTGGTGFHYAIGTANTSNWTSNYNFLATKDVNRIGNWNNSAKSFAAWQTSGGDIYGWSVQTGSSPLLDPSNLFTDYINGNLNIKTENPECWYVNGKGMPVTSVNTDYSNNSRSTVVVNGSTDIGSDEFSAGIAPPAITINPVPGLNTFSFAGRTISTVNFTTAILPSTLSLSYYSGTNPPNAFNTYGNSYYNFIPTGTNAGLNYTLVLYFDPREQCNISNPANLGFSKSNDEGETWNFVSGTTYTAGPPAYVTATGQTSFSMFSFTQKDNPLPVHLVSFTASVEKRDVILNWATEMEIDNSGFELERNDAKSINWVKVSFVNSRGNSNTITSYTFEDKKLNSGRYKYRLKQIDYNSNFTYYNLNNTVDVGIPDNFNLSQNYPNPFNPITKIDYDLPEDSKIKIILYDITGREVNTLVDEYKKAGYYTIGFNASGLSSGVYFYRIIAGGYIATKKMMLVK